MKHIKHWLATLAVLLCSVTASAATYSDWTSTNQGQNNSTSSNTYNITASAGDVLTFDWLVSSESSHDKLIVTLNGSEILNKSGEQSGTYQHTFTSSGSYTMVVKYTKDGSVNNGSDYAKVYNVTLSTENSGNSDSENIIASGSCGDNLTWELNKEGELTIEGTGAMTDYTFDSAPWYNYKESIKSVIIKEGVTSISSNTFDYYNLTSITIPSSVIELGNGFTTGAFDYCYYTADIYIESIEWWLNYGAEGIARSNDQITYLYIGGELLTDLEISSSIKSIPNRAFLNCRAITSVTLEDGITEIGLNTFYGCRNLTSIDIPESVLKIGAYAFYDCSNLLSITLPSSITLIGGYAFDECSNLCEVYCEATTPPFLETSAMSSISSSAILYVPKSSLLTYKTDSWIKYFSKIEALPSIVIASGTCGDNLTWKLTDEGELIIEGEGEMKISPWSEYEGSIKSVVIGEGVTSISSYAFFNCTNLTSIDIPESVSKIGQYAFANTGWYNNQPNGLVYIENWLYGYKGEMPENFELVVEDGTKGIADYAFESSSNLIMATIPESVSYIGDAAFIQSGLGLITMPEGVKSIGGGAFWGCYRLEGVSIPESVTEVGSAILEGTSWYRNQPCGMLYLSGWALGLKNCGECDICQKMNSQISILEGTKGLADGCLYEYSSAIIPESVTYFCSGALHSNRGDFNIICKALVPSCNVDEKTFEYVKNSAILYVPASAVNAYKNDKYWGEFTNIQAINFPVWTLTTEGELIVDGVGAMDNYGVHSERSPWAIYDTFIKSVTVKEGITSVGDNAFVYCEEIESASLPNSLTSIGVGAFAECDNLKSIVIPENVTTLGDGAFHGCGISYISCNAMTPPVIAEYTFHYVSKSIPVYVPLSSIPSYSNTEYWNEFTDIQAMPEFITINQYGSGTYCPEYALDFSEVEGLKAYAATGYDTETGVVTLSRVMTAKAGVGLFIKGEPGDYVVPVLESTSFNTLNMLVGTSEEVTLGRTSEDGLYVNYKYTLSGDNATPQFYVFDDGFTLGAGKAYLQVPAAWVQTEARSISLRFDDGETTDIEESKLEIENSTIIFDLMGRRVVNPVKGGVYVVNGKKVIY